MMPQSPTQSNPPRWLRWAFPLAAALACAGALTAVWSGWHSMPFLPGGRIADRIFEFDGRQVREHCTTCHPQGRPADGTAHPDIAPHRSDRLGCTACHLGEGMALDRTISHGLPGNGARQILKGNDLEGRCYACHDLKPLPGAERAWAGALLFQTKACDLCHRLGNTQPGGLSGPDLGTIGSQLGLARLREAIKEPGKNLPDAVMPRFPLVPGQVDQLALFLKSRITSANHQRQLLPALEQGPPASPLERHRCLACHRFGDRDGRVGPDLTYIADQRPSVYLKEVLVDPGEVIPGAIMPLPKLTDAERQEIAVLLLEQARGSLAMTQARPLYMHLCQRCHAADGNGRGPIQPNLAFFPRPFAENADFFRRVDDERLRQSLRAGVPGTSMPPFGRLLSEDQRGELLDLLFTAFIGVSRSDKALLPPLPPAPSNPLPATQGEKLFETHCARCHGADGSGWGPESPGMQPRPRDFTNRVFMAAVADERLLRAIFDGVPGTAMAPFRSRLTPEELTALSARVRVFARSSDD